MTEHMTRPAGDDRLRMTVARQLVAALEEQGFDTVFGIPGEETLELVGAIRDSGMQLILTRHEQHAAFMAATHGRLTGRPGLVLSTVGPGATNLTTGLAHATLGGMPVVALVAQKPIADNPDGLFQLIDLGGIGGLVTKHVQTINDPDLAIGALRSCLAASIDDRPGASMLVIPEDIASTVPDSRLELGDWRPAAPIAADSSLHRMAEMIDRAEFPVIVAGHGCAPAAVSGPLAAFATSAGIGVLTTQMGAGAVPSSEDSFVGALGFHGEDYVHLVLENADLVILAGYHPVEYPPDSLRIGDAEIVHLAPWRPEPAMPEPTLTVRGDLAGALERLGSLVAPRNLERASELRRLVDGLLSREPSSTFESPLDPLAVVRAVSAAAGEDGVVALDNTVTKIWFCRHFHPRFPQQLLVDNALATMGAGLAIGTAASLIHPDRWTVVVAGDGGFLMNVGDLETAVRLGVDLTIVVLRDEAFGFIAWEQRSKGYDRTAVDFGNPDFVRLAESFGAAAVRVGENGTLSDLLEKAKQAGGVTLIDCPVDNAANDRLEGLLTAARGAHRQSPLLV